MRLVHTADIHFRPKRAAEVFASLDTLASESRDREVQLIAIAGDLYDSAVFASGQYPEFVERIRQLADIAPVVMVYGTPSHDIAGSLDVLESLESTYGVTVLEPGHGYFIGGALVFGIPEPSKAWLLAGREALGREETDAAMKEGMQALLLGLAAQRREHPDIPCVVVYHGEIRGATMANGQTAEGGIGRDDLAMIGADYYALGHIHEPQQIDYLAAYYPGSVYPINWGETHQAGFNLVEIDNGPPPEESLVIVRHLHYPHPRQVKIETAHGENRIMPDITGLRVWQEISCARDEAATIDTEALTESLRAWGAVEGSRVTLKVTNTETTRAAEIAAAQRLRDKVAIYAENSGDEIGDGVLAKADELESGDEGRVVGAGAHIRLRRVVLRGAIGIWKGWALDEIEVDLDEYEPGLILLDWPNGKGKTTLIENLHPWPQLMTRGGKLSSHFRLRDSFRDLTWTDERTGDEYRSLLQINGTSKAGEVDYLLYRNGEPVDGINGRKDPYVEAINELWGGISLYQRSAFVTQTDAGLASATNAERIEIVRELAGLDYLQAHSDEAKDRAKRITDELATDDGWITATEERLAALPDLRAAQAEAAAGVRGGEEAVRKIEEAGKALRERRDEMAERVEANNALLRESRELTGRDYRLSEEAKLLERRREEWERMSAGRAEAQERIANWEELESERKDLEAAKAAKLAKRTEALEAYQSAREAYEGKRREGEEAKRGAETRLDALARDRQEALSSIEMLGGLLDKPRQDTCPECGARLPWADDEAARREEWQSKLKLAQETVWEIDKEIPAVEDAVEAAAASLRELAEPEKPAFTEPAETAELERVAEKQDYLRIDEARETVRRAEEAAVRIEEIDTRAAAIVNERNDIDTRQGELAVEVDLELDAACAAVERDLEDSRQQHAEARETLAALRSEAESIARQIAELETTEAELAERRQAVYAKREAAEQWSYLQRALGRQGVQALELDALAPSIEDVANRLLSAAYGVRFSVRFQTTKLDSTGKRQLETFDIQVADSEHGDEQELSTLSGGEGVWIKRALYDAFGIIRARNTGLRFLTVCQDETDGALDPEHREQYARMLEAAHTESGRVHTILITHSSEVQEMIGQRIEVAAPQPATAGAA